ncbi:cleavage stimulation factor 3' pre-RNA subunit 3 [Cricetulus griseus]
MSGDAAAEQAAELKLKIMTRLKREAVGSYAENQRITAVRRVYQRGCVNPMINIEQLWRDYNKYEEEYETVMKGLDRNAPSVPPQNTPQEAQQVDMWKKYIQWEKSNPLRTEDQTLITKRVMFAYEQCLLVLGHHPDIWYEAAQYLEQSSKLLAEKGDMNNAKLFSDEAANIYERAISTLLKKNMLLYFAYADYEESRMKYEKVHSIYNRLLAIEDIDPTLDVSRAKLAAIIPDPVVAPSIVPVLKDEVDRKPEYPKPDTQQMIPFQPRHLAPVEEAVRIITGGAPELAVEGNGPVESSAVLTKAVKRPNEDSDEDEEKGAVVPPVHDIYRARQQKRIR